MPPTNSPFPHEHHQADVCVVGGGMAGVCAALAAARHGAKVVLMHDRPVLGGNSSRECRVHIQGADRHNGIKHMRETGILEELRLDNLRHNPHKEYPLWDLVLYQKLRCEPNVELLLNCSCQEARTEGDHIQSVTGWQLTTQTFHTVEARLFADCSGDAVLAPLTAADFRRGREARNEYGESIAPEIADDRTMGMTCLFTARPYDTPQPYEAPGWVDRITSADEIPYGGKQCNFWRMGYWWIELGGEHDSIRDTEVLRDRLLNLTLGVWDWIKNGDMHRDAARNWALTWIAFLPGKRESRRYIGDHVLNQNDIEAEGRFEDTVAYGGWSMDDHHPAGFYSARIGAPATIFHPAPSPYGIPYRCLFSRNIDNLFFAGRCHSATHAAMSSTRVMGTGSVLGQAVGTAAGLAIQKGILPRGMTDHMDELQQTLIADDCYLPWVAYQHASLVREAKLETSQGDPEPVRDGFFRQIGDNPHAWTARPGDTLTYTFASQAHVTEARLVLDSAMEENVIMSERHREAQLIDPPRELPERFRLEGRTGDSWETLARVEDNHQRHVRVPVDRDLKGIRFVLEETRGADESRVYGFTVH